MIAAADPQECPYVGLDPFDSAHADYFFGRRQESKIIADHVLARPVTVLYGPSGVGKSSILNVGVPAALQQIADAEREQAEPSEPAAEAAGAEGTNGAFTVRWLRDWQDLDKARAVLVNWLTESTRRPVLIILDQFEEYFLYRDQIQASAVDRVLGDLVARRDLRVHLLFGLRDDALHHLDGLRAFVPAILETTIELRGLNDAGIRDAIVGPIERYNGKYRNNDSAIVVEDGLVATLIRQLKQADTTVSTGPATASKQRGVELPYLQLALTKLWAAEGGAAATALREPTLVHRLGGVARIVRDHVNDVMRNLSADEQALCARLFDRLVTAIGGKIAYPTAALAAPEVAGPNVSEQTVNAVLNKLTGREQRILKPVMTDGGDGFEIFHDVLGLPVLEWKRNFEIKQKQWSIARLRTLTYVLAALMTAGLVGWITQSYIADEWRWLTVTRPYMVSQVRSHVLSAAKEQALKPGDSFKECAMDCPEMVVVPAGLFTMGSPPTEKGRDNNEGPQHTVTIANPFAVSKYELTFADWDACLTGGGCNGYRPNDQGWEGGQRPVIVVSWEEAQQYVAWLSLVTGKTYRLLSEAEYEYAMRAGTTTTYPWGDDIELNGHAMANCGGCGSRWDGQKTAPVGSFPANKFGLYDMAGNVWEWIEDCWHDNYDGAPTNGSAWLKDYGGDCSRHIVRGGSWFISQAYLRSAYRRWLTSDSRAYFFGFRVARTLLTP